MESIIIDAYNLMHKVSELKILMQQSQDITVDTMVSKLQGHYFGRSAKIILVFDGLGKNRHEQNIDVKFARTGLGPDYGNADELIKHLIEKSKNPKLIKIVSSDRGITWFAKDCGCRIQSSDSFWGEIKDKRIQRKEAYRESKEKPDFVTKGEFDYMLKEFKKK
jgi:predicted RNA-binding protein with PIN domain